MQSIVRKAVRPFTVVLKGIILTLIICATGGAWARTTLLNYMNFDTVDGDAISLQKDGGTLDPVQFDDSTISKADSSKFGANAYMANEGVVGLRDISSGLVPVADGFTISFWFHPNNSTDWRSFFGFGFLNGKNYRFDKEGTNLTIYESAASGDSGTSGTSKGSASFTANAWNHVAIVCQPGGSSLTLYVNGTAKSISIGDISSTSLSEVRLCYGRCINGVDGAVYRSTYGKQITWFDDFALFSGALNWPAISMISAGASTISDLVARGLDVSLEEFGGFVTTEPQLAFKNATLSEITADSLQGRFGGSSIAAKGKAATFFNFASPDSATLTCEAQMDGDTNADVEILKSVFLTFTQSGYDVYVSANSVTKWMNKGGNPLGTSLANQGNNGSLATSLTASGYGIYNLRLPRTYESDATVVWNAGELLMPKIGTDGNKYVISLPASGISVDGSGNLKVASSGATTGATIDTPNTHIASVLIKYSSLSACANSKVSLATAKATYNANGSLVVVGARTTANNALTMTGYWDNSSENTYGFNTVPSLTAGAGYFMYSYHNDTCGNGGTYAYAGTSLSNLSGGGNTTLRWTNDGYWIKQLSVGGPITTNSGVKAWPNVAIEKVALFIGSESYYKGSDVSGFLFSTEATITAAGTYTLAGNNPLFASVNSDESYLINVLESATLSIPAATSVNKITFNVAEGKTLTLTGSTLTATGGIKIVGKGTVAMTASLLHGTVYGNGTLYYNNVRPTTSGTDVVLTNSEWRGTVRITYNKENTATSTDRQLFPQHWGSANSKIKWNGVAGYFGGCTSAAGWVLEDLTVDATTYPALKKNDGGSSALTTAPSVEGDGEFCDASDPTERFRFTDGSAFKGKITITRDAGKGMNVQFGSTAVDVSSRTIHVLSGASVTVASGKTWQAGGGIVINGTLTLADETSGLQRTIHGTGSIVSSGTEKVPDIDLLTGSEWAGTVEVSGADTYQSMNGSPSTKFMSSNSTLKLTSGHLGLTGVTSLPGKVSIASGATLYLASDSLTDLTLNYGTVEGQINLAMSTKLENLTLNIGTARSLPGTLVTGINSVTIALKEVPSEGGTITFDASGLPGAITSVNYTLTYADGTALTPTSSTTEGSVTTFKYTPHISGVATDIDWDFTDGTDDALEQAPSGVGKNQDSTLSFYVDSEDPSYTGVYLKHHPYVDGAANFIHDNSSAITVAAVGTMPSGEKTIFMNFGSAYANKYGLLLANTTVANEVLVAYNYGATVTPITTMTVPNAATARHSYIITKEDGASSTTFTVYLDGIKWKTVTTNFKIEFSNANTGIQFGSDFGGNIRKTGFSAVSDNTGILNVLRVYGRVITPAEIAAYASTYPYVSPNGSSARTFTAAEEDWIDTTVSSEVWENSSEDDSGTPTAGASVTVTATAETEITVNLAEDTQYEALTINGSRVVFKPSYSGLIKVSGMTVVGAPVTVKYGAVDMTGGPMTITEDGDITFDYSAFDASAIYTVTDIPLTSDVDQSDSKVHLTAPTTPYRTYSLVYTSGHYVMRITPNSNPDSVVYYNGGYWGTTESTFAVKDSSGNNTIVFPGDTVVIPSNYNGTSADFGASLPANVAAIRVEKNNFTFESGVDGTAILSGVTVTVAEGCTLSFATSSHNLTLGNVTFNGPGGVAIPCSASISGAISGTATVTVDGSVSVASSGSIANTISGSGTITYAALPSVAPAGFSTWTGTVVLNNCGSITEQGRTPFELYGCAGSKIKAPGFDGYSALQDASQHVCEAELVIDAGDTVRFNHGFKKDVDFETLVAARTDAGYFFKKLSGAGTLVLDGDIDKIQYVFKDASEFTGAVTITDPTPDDFTGGKKSFVFGDSDNLAWTINNTDFPAYLVIAGNLAVAAGKTWNVPAGIVVVDGKTLTLGKNSVVSGISTESKGTLSVAASATATINDVMGEEITANIVIPGTGKLNISDTAVETLTLSCQNAGALDLSGCTSLKTLYLDLGNATATGLDNVTLPTSCKTVYFDIGSVRDLIGHRLPSKTGVTKIAYCAKETLAEYANGEFEVTNVAIGDALELFCRSGAIIVLNQASTTRSYTGGRDFAGAACWHEWDFEGTTGLDDTGMYSDNVADTLAGTTIALLTVSEPTYQGIKVANRENMKAISSADKPYATGMTFPMPWSAAVRCSMPTGSDNVAVSFGDTSSSVLGLAKVGDDTVQLFSWNYGDTARTSLAEVKVESPSDDDNMHIYVIVVTEENSKKYVAFYRDGEFIHKTEVNLTGAITKVTVGGIAGDAVQCLPGDANDGYVDYVRLYNKIITDLLAESLSARRPFLSAKETYIREVGVASAHGWSATGEWTKKQAGGTAACPTASDNVTVTSPGGVGGALAVNLSDDAKYGTMIFSGSGDIAVSRGDYTGKIGAEMLVVRTGINLTVAYNAVNFTDTAVAVDPGAILKFSMAGYPFEGVAATTEVQLTGVVAAHSYDNTVDSRILVTDAPASGICTLEKFWKADHSCWVRITPYRTFTVEVPDNTAVTVTGATDNEDGTYTAQVGSSVTVTYAATEGYLVSGQDEQTVTVATNTENIPAPVDYQTLLIVAQVGTTAYATFAEALASVPEKGTTLTLLAPLALTSTVTIDKSMTLDLNGFNVTATDCRAFHVTAGTVVFTGSGTVSTVVTEGTAFSKSSSVIRVGSDTAVTSFTLGAGVTVSSDYCYGITYFGREAQTVVINGTVAVTGEQAAISGNGNSWNAAVTLTVNGSVTATQDYAIYNPQKGTTTINGTVTGLGGIEVKAGTVTVNNGATITATALAQSHKTNNDGTSTTGYAIASVGNVGYANNAAVVITGGTITGPTVTIAENNATAGGAVTAATDQIPVPSDYKWVETETPGVYELVAKTYVAEVDGQGYETFADALAAAENKTLTLLAPLALTSTVTVDKSMTFDLNGFNVTATDCRAFHVTAGTVVFTGSGTVSTVVTEGTAFSNSSSVIRVGSDTAVTSFTLGAGVTVSSDYCYGITYFGREAQTVVINGTVAVTGEQAAISGNGNSWNAAVTLTVTGTVSATQDYAIYNPQTGTTTINGTVTGLGGIEVKAGTVTVNPGAVITATAQTQSHEMNNNGTSTTGYAIASIGNAGYANNAAVKIAGGTINGQSIIIAENGASEGGAVTATSNLIPVPADYKWVASETPGEYELVAKIYVAEVDGQGYETFAEALAVAENETITMLRDVVLLETSVSGAVTIDLNGKTLSGSIVLTARVASVTVSGGTFTAEVSTNVSGGATVISTTSDDVTTYKVVYGTIFSVW